MADFDFVADDALRASLEADAAEMQACVKVSAFKAVHVLAGSIVEAVLVDHLERAAYTPPKDRAVRELALGELIAAARDTNSISERAANLATAVKSYRNLIHPGRMTRLQESVDYDTASIAGHLVGVISTEIAALRQQKYGYTAQQLATKIETDASSLSILADLVTNSEDREVEKLLTEAIPRGYISLEQGDYFNDDPFPALDRWKRAYRIAFTSASEAVCRRVCANHARILREGSDFEVRAHETAFFQASDLECMDEGDRALALKHLWTQIGSSQFGDYIDTIIGLGAYMQDEHAGILVGAIVRWGREGDPDKRPIVYQRLKGLREETADTSVSVHVDNALGATQQVHLTHQPDYSKWLKDAIEEMLHPIPWL